MSRSTRRSKISGRSIGRQGRAAPVVSHTSHIKTQNAPFFGERSVSECDPVIRPDVRPSLGGAAAALLTEAHLLRQIGARFGVIGRDHRVIGGKTPFFAVFLRRKSVLRPEMALQRLELLAVLE